MLKLHRGERVNDVARMLWTGKNGAILGSADQLPVDSHGMPLERSALRSKWTFRSHLRFALNSFLPYLFHHSIRLASPDPTLPEIGSVRKKREAYIGEAYPYAGHLHRSYIRIYLPSAYVLPIQTSSGGIYSTYAGILPGTLSI